MPTDLEKQIDGLYGAPPEGFVERRDELARSLREDGNRQAADEVKAFRKPTVAAWTVNQLARSEKMRLRGLLTAGERLRKAHEQLLGGGSPEALQRARDDEREAIAGLVRAAEPLLEEAGHPASEATLDRVRRTLHAAVVDEEIGRRVREGRLEKEEQATGFGFGSLPAAPAKPGTRTKGRTPAKRDRGRKAEQESAARARRDRERKQQEEARERRRRAEERLRGARRALKEAERAAERAERELRSRRADVERAEEELEQARRSRKRS